MRGELHSFDENCFAHSFPSVPENLKLTECFGDWTEEPGATTTTELISMPVSVSCPPSTAATNMPSQTACQADDLFVIRYRTSGSSSLCLFGDSASGGSKPNSSSAVDRLVRTLAEWLVVLRGIAEEREADQPPVRCRCKKAEKIHQELRLLGHQLRDAEQLCERAGMVPEEDIEEISSHVQRIAGVLRSEVSILIPTTIGGTDPLVAEQASWLLQDFDTRNCVSGAIEAVTELVQRLLGVGHCLTCQGTKEENGETPSDIDPSILSLVRGFCGDISSSDNSDTDMGSDELVNSRKRKQTQPARFLSPLPPGGKFRKLGSPPPHVPKESPEGVVNLLEKKKKQVKKDGLYKFVLWREALKDEKSKVGTD